MTSPQIIPPPLVKAFIQAEKAVAHFTKIPIKSIFVEAVNSDKCSVFPLALLGDAYIRIKLFLLIAFFCRKVIEADSLIVYTD